MDILVSIPDEVYDYEVVDELDIFLADYFGGTYSKITTLPKGHGKIIDESQITQVYYTLTMEEKYMDGVLMPQGIEITGTNAPAIVEQNKEVSYG